MRTKCSADTTGSRTTAAASAPAAVATTKTHPPPVNNSKFSSRDTPLRGCHWASSIGMSVDWVCTDAAARLIIIIIVHSSPFVVPSPAISVCKVWRCRQVACFGAGSCSVFARASCNNHLRCCRSFWWSIWGTISESPNNPSWAGEQPAKFNSLVLTFALQIRAPVSSSGGSDLCEI